jgi:hypothetical protein
VLLSAFGIRISVESADARFIHLLGLRYSNLVSSVDDKGADLRFRHRRDESGAMHLLLADGEPLAVRDSTEALDRIDTEIVLALQRLRSDLLFVHAAALARGGRCCLLAAESGVGKSTTAWGLLHHGFSYASDELSAIDPVTLRVHPYPRALCLKQQPPPPYGAPPSTVQVDDCLHVPADALPCRSVGSPSPVAALFILERAEAARPASIRPIGAAEAAARVYPAVLNALAHPDRGLSPVLRIVREVPCFRLSLGPLEQNCVLIRDVFDSLELPDRIARWGYR